MWRYIRQEQPLHTEEDKEKIELVDWALNSHFWQETSPGYAECKYCKSVWTNQMGISVDTKPWLCMKNPIIKNILNSAKIVYENL
jgi:hypothetical protein